MGALLSWITVCNSVIIFSADFWGSVIFKMTEYGGVIFSAVFSTAILPSSVVVLSYQSSVYLRIS